MYIKHLEVFINIVNYKSFSKAAEAVYISQPSVSACINALEKEMGVQLLNRTTKEVYPTPAGKYFYEQAKLMLATYKKTKERIKEIVHPNADKTIEAQIEFPASSTPAQFILPKLLSMFHRDYPNIRFNIIQMDSTDVVKSILSNRYEVGIIGAKIETNRCSYLKYISDRLILISSKKQSNGKAVDLRNYLESEELISRENGSGTKLAYDAYFNELGIKPSTFKICATFSSMQSIIYAVSEGLGSAIVSELAAQNSINKETIHELKTDPPLPSRDFYFVSKKDFVVSPATELFIDYALSRI